MTGKRWQRVEELYHAALSRAEGERGAFLARECDDEELRREVESLLQQSISRDKFLASAGAMAAAAPLVTEGPPSPVIGRRIGAYDLQAPLGAGGMGNVYRARDTKLKRDVAIKLLPHVFTADPERLARFEREARVLAALNHPHIGAIYGVEETDGVGALVLELVDGDTLEQRIARGPIPWKEALPMAQQIAEALETAHEAGIVHRDLKPANIKITPQGIVKVLDFGLAKLVPVAPNDAEPAGQGGEKQLASAPTVTIGGTKEGVILGTAAYMSPEQARGQSVDKRTDIWAFGCVLFEMLSGRAAFAGETVSDTLVKVLEREPDWLLLPPDTPPSVTRLLRRSLEKERKRRLADISDARLDITEALTPSASNAARMHAPESHRVSRRLVIALSISLTVGGVVVGSALWRATRATAPRVTRTTITPADGQTLSADTADRFVTIAPDGTRLGYLVFLGPQSNRLFVRTLDQLEPTELTGLGDTTRGPFFSPDGAWIGFFDVAGLLKKVAMTGGPAATVCRFDGSGTRGATWSTDGTIIFATSDTSSGLWQVPASGGAPKMLTKPNPERGERDHLWPRVLPGGRAVLFTIMPTTGGIENAQVAVLDLRSGAQKILLRGGTDAQYAPTGHLVFGAAGTLRAVAFDPNRLEIRGTPAPVVSQVMTTESGANAFDLATDGTLVYLSGNLTTDPLRTLVWVDRHGVEVPLGAPARAYLRPRLSPDGTRVIVDSQDAERDIWLWDFARKTLTRLTFDPTSDGSPIWAQDGRHVLFSSLRSGVYNLFSVAADGSGTPERLLQSSTHNYPTSVTPDGRQLVFSDVMKTEVMMLNLDDNKHVTPLVQTPFAERNGDISPDGRWLAYESNESGKSEIYVRPFPDVNSGRWQVSNAGGTRPHWARSSRELFYVAPPGALMSVRIKEGSTFNASEPVKLFEGRYYYGAPPVLGVTYDVSPDGERFLMTKPVTDAPSSPTIVIVQNWQEELKRLVPTQ
jgi:eukaryotic-like serine/threonine-protein kinase